MACMIPNITFSLFMLPTCFASDPFHPPYLHTHIVVHPVLLFLLPNHPSFRRILAAQPAPSTIDHAAQPHHREIVALMMSGRAQACDTHLVRHFCSSVHIHRLNAYLQTFDPSTQVLNHTHDLSLHTSYKKS